MSTTGWVWTIIIIIIIVLGGWYAYSMMGAMPASNTTTPTATTTTQTTTSAAPSNNIYMTANDATKGAYMTDFQSMTLYTYDKDTSGVSNCNGACAQAWPPYTSGATAQGTFPTGISVITRADGSTQFAYNGKPLYYYAEDSGPNMINGDGVGGVWHIVKM